MKRLIYFLIILFLVFPVVLIVTPITIIGQLCETIGHITEEYLNWTNRLLDKF